MATIPKDFHGRFTACLARSDATEAQRLIAIVKAAQASGNASGAGWGNELAKLSAIVESQPQGLSKRFAGPSEPVDMPLPPDLAARTEVALAKMALASTPREVEVAKADCEAVYNDIKTYALFRGATAPASAKSLFDGITGR